MKKRRVVGLSDDGKTNVVNYWNRVCKHEYMAGSSFVATVGGIVDDATDVAMEWVKGVHEPQWKIGGEYCPNGIPATYSFSEEDLVFEDVTDEQ